MKICIIGVGAIGSLLGFYLSARAEVWLLGRWQAHIDAVNHEGLRCELDGAESTRFLHATADPAAVGGCDVALVAVKAHQTAWAAEQARAFCGPHGDGGVRTLVVTLQNGIGNRELLAAHLGADCVGQGVTSLGATLLGPGRVRHAGRGPTIFGVAHDRARMAELAALFESCGLPAGLSDDLDALVWGKLVVNAGINALSALLRIPNGALAGSAEVRQLIEQAVSEAAAVAAARGIRLPYDDAITHVLNAARATAANHSSMLQDVLRGSPTEIATINGAIVAEGRRLGVPTPINALLAALVGALDATAAVRIAESPHCREEKSR